MNKIYQNLQPIDMGKEYLDAELKKAKEHIWFNLEEKAKQELRSDIWFEIKPKLKDYFFKNSSIETPNN